MPEPVEVSVKDQQEFNASVEESVAGLVAPARNKVKKLLKGFACIFTTSNKRQGRTAVVKPEIDTGEARPIKQAPRKIPLAKRYEVKELVDEMNRSGVIEISGLWSRPVLIRKKDGNTIFCADYRKLNDVSENVTILIFVLLLQPRNLKFSTLSIKPSEHSLEIEVR